MKQYYSIDDISISKWNKLSDSFYEIVISAKDGFSSSIPNDALVGVSDNTTIDELKVLIKPFVENIITVEYSERDYIAPIDLLNNNN